ncbi:methyltransferase family protein [Xenorhabdus bovienii]|uniref:Isoprenylcysteine carboxyl methyltransferase n=1 Tax=Xenorhabdus bovienii TaxID=40576 RepID=A0A0B6XFT7_XENBV|nr:isoprenylcysteine carboxylmethyltransferase family protein [Xenorhabdus bovienii]CDM91329.1 membrane protein of unknown function [Xenorhabdus bovienii]
MRKFRYFLFIIFLIPIIISWWSSYLSGYRNTVPYFVASIAVLNELFFLNEVSNVKSKDQGIVSALVVSALMSLLLYFSAGRAVMYLHLLLSTVLILIGSGMRTLSKITLGIYFSHTLRIINNHKLINHGVFRLIRHPAYSGTIIIMSGFGFFVSISMGLVCFFIFFILSMRRIESEENMMMEKFGSEYLDYRKNTWKLFPFII